MNAPTPPSDLPARGRGRRFWRGVVNDYTLRVDELEVLAEVCRQLETLDSLRWIVSNEGVTSVGAGGQVVAHPALVESRQIRTELRRSLAQIGLPDEGEQSAPKSRRHQRAAQTRWAG